MAIRVGWGPRLASPREILHIRISAPPPYYRRCLNANYLLRWVSGAKGTRLQVLIISVVVSDATRSSCLNLELDRFSV